MSASRSVLVLGGSGFIGQAVVTAAVAAGLRVSALARSESSAVTVAALGARPVRGDTQSPADWITECAGVDALIDLTQPAVPSRLTVRTVGRMAQHRLAATQSMLDALDTLPESARPWWICVNGTDDLLPDPSGVLSSRSPLRAAPYGFAHIGLPVRAVLEASSIEATYVYLGQMVYGAGKAYTGVVVEGIRTGKAKIVGSGNNILPLTHVQDAAAAIIHVLRIGREEMVGRTVVAVPATPATQRDLFALTAQALNRPVPSRVPTALAALVAGRVNAQIMTLNAHCDPDLLTATGFTFRHHTLAGGIVATLAAIEPSVAIR